MTNPSQVIDDYVQSHLDQSISELTELCAQPSVSARSEGVRECSSLIARILERHGFQVQVLETPGNPVVVGHADGKSPNTFLFYNHYDVQPPEPLELWTTPPYEPTLREGAVYARGSADDKGEFIARIAAIEAARNANDGALPCGITFVVEGEEEIGSPHIAQFVREHIDLLQSQAALWEGGGIDTLGNPGMTLGVRGILGVELAVETLSQDAHSGGAHIFPNAAWRLIRAVTSLKDPDEKICIPGFYDRVVPPSEQDLKLIDMLPDTEAWLRQAYGVKEFVGGLTGKDLDRAVFNNTCNIGGITTGYQGKGMKTVIPARASAKIDFRLVPDQDPDDIFARLRAYLDGQGFTDVSLTRLGSMWPYKAPADDPLIELTAESAEEVYQQPYFTEPLSGGSSPVYAFAKPLGNIPVVWAGVGYGNNRAHSPDEHVRLVDFVNGARHIARIINAFPSVIL
ncbi:MAG: M20/M25/M40 family metallo-hydrolase [Omnitrophica WOR_2 bacterium]